MPPPARAGGRAKAAAVAARVALVALIALVTFALLFSMNMAKPLDHDEHQFVAAGALLARRGLLPYHDYPYFHMPNLVFVYAGLFRLTPFLLLASRAFSTLCGLGTLGVVFASGWSLFRRHAPRVRGAVAGGAAAVLMADPLFTVTSGRAWNHDFPVLCTLLALLALRRGLVPVPAGPEAVAAPPSRGRGGSPWLLASGLLLGAAAGARLTFVPALCPFVGIVLACDWLPPRRRFALAAIFCAGLLVTLAPPLVLWAMAPRPFLFGNLLFPRLHNIYRLARGEGERMTAGGKVAYVLTRIVILPGTLLLVAALGVVLIAGRRGRGPAASPAPGAGGFFRFQTLALTALLCFLLVGSVIPSPAFHPYYYAPVPFTLLLLLHLLSRAAGPTRGPGQGSGLLKVLGVMAAVSVLCGAHFYVRPGNLLHPGEWVPVQAHRLGEEVRRLAGAGERPGGPVLTLAPVFALEGGADIYEAFATGPLTTPIAPMLDEEQKELYRLVDGRRPPPSWGSRRGRRTRSGPTSLTPPAAPFPPATPACGPGPSGGSTCPGAGNSGSPRRPTKRGNRKVCRAAGHSSARPSRARPC